MVASETKSPRVVQFGAFEVDLQTRELRKSGLKLRIHDQPFQILAALVDRPGEIITRDELRNKLWPTETFVDFDHGINTAVNKLRDLLGDSADHPRFIETLARRGYRFVAPVDVLANEAAAAVLAPIPVRAEDTTPGSKGGNIAQARGWMTWERLIWLLFAAAAATVTFLFVSHLAQQPGEGQRLRFQISVPENVRLTPAGDDIPVISPDGKHFVFTGVASDGTRHLWIRSLDSLTTEMLPETERSSFPFWSPDSHSVGFGGVEGTKRALKKIDLRGGPAQRICDVNGFVGGTWNREGIILFAQGRDVHPTMVVDHVSMYRVSAAGGEPKRVSMEPEHACTARVLPHFLPDGQHFLYACFKAQGEGEGIRLADLNSKQTRMLIPGASNVYYAPPGFLIYGRHDKLLAQAFDAKGLRLIGDPLLVAERVGREPNGRESHFSVSENGILIYGGALSNSSQLAWYNRDGARQGSITEPGMYEGINLAASERWVALERRDPRTMKVGIWTLELSTGILSLVTSHLAESSPPVLSPDGREVAFTSLRNGVFTLYRKELGGGDAEVLIESNDMPVAQQWLSDGSILFNSGRVRDFYLLPLLGRRTPVLLFATDFRKAAPQVSSDGRWVSYQANESGRWEVYIATFPTFKEKRQVSVGGGCQPRWRKDRKELFYLSLDGRLMSVAVKGAAKLEITTPKPMFQTSLRGAEEKKYWVTGDGNRFILVEPLEDSTKPFTVILNWTTGLKH